MTTVSTAAVSTAPVRAAAPWVERLARVGYAAKAVLYGTVGLLAARAALGHGGRTTDQRGAMAAVVAAPFGRALLAVIAVGLLGYAVWRVIEAVFDPERHGGDAKGIALRASFVARGVVHAALAVSAARLALRGGGAAEGGARTEGWTARALELPAGELLVWAAAAILAGYGAWQLWRAAAAKLSKRLDLGRMSAEAGRWVIGVSRAGIAARGVVFVAIALLFARAASRHSASEAGGVADGLRELARLGRLPLAAIAFGLVAYGVYELLNARYRRIRVQ